MADCRLFIADKISLDGAARTITLLYFSLHFHLPLESISTASLITLHGIPGTSRRQSSNGLVAYTKHGNENRAKCTCTERDFRFYSKKPTRRWLTLTPRETLQRPSTPSWINLPSIRTRFVYVGRATHTE